MYILLNVWSNQVFKIYESSQADNASQSFRFTHLWENWIIHSNVFDFNKRLPIPVL